MELAQCTTVRNIRKKSINECFLVLGAPWDEVYSDRETRNNRAKRTIYNRYCKEDLLTWAENLWKQAIVKNHPDKHKSEDFYNQTTQVINMAFQRIKLILNRRKRYD